MKIQLSYGAIYQLGLWEDYCNKYGMSEWALNEGLDRDRFVGIEIDEDKSNIVLLRRNK
jgi:hypothetical protein